MTGEWEQAALRGDARALADQIAAGADVDALDRYGQTALMLAAPRGHLDAIRVLIGAGANLDRTAKYGLSATMLAVVNLHEDVAQELAAAGADLRPIGSGAPGFAGKTAAALARDRGLDALAGALTPPAGSTDLRRIDAAFRAGDLDALLAAVDDPGAVPNGPMPVGIGLCLEYAIYHAPLDFIRRLVALGAELDPEVHDGFPPLIAALSCCASRPGSPARPDVPEILDLLLTSGANPDQRGTNDYTPLHMAVAEGNRAALVRLLEAGADPHLRTRIDACETPGELARTAGLSDLAELLAAAESDREPPQ